MKVYEKLGLPYLTAEQFAGIRTGCPKNSHPEYRCNNDTCTECYYNYLNSEVSTKKVKRWETYNGDFVKAYTEWADNKRLCLSKSAVPDDCRKYKQCSECYNAWLMEEIEVEE